MRKFLTIWRRELAACFLSPVAYVTIVVFLAVSGLTFLWGVIKSEGTGEQLSPLLFGAIVVWLTVLVTVISMRLFADEKRSGTIETLMTAPITEAEVVLGKYAGALSFLLIVALPAVGCIFLLERLSPGIDFVDLDIGAMLGGCLILFLISAFFVSTGLFISLMTRNQIVAAICCICAIWLALLFGHLVSTSPMGLEKFGEYVSATTHIEDFSRGSVDTRPIILYLSGTVFMLFAAVRVLESRRWR